MSLSIPEKDFIFIWDMGKAHKEKKPFIINLHIPVSKNSKGAFYNKDSKNNLDFSIKIHPGKELELTYDFIHELILFSFHLIEIFNHNDASSCEKFLKKFKQNEISFL